MMCVKWYIYEYVVESGIPTFSTYSLDYALNAFQLV